MFAFDRSAFAVLLPLALLLAVVLWSNRGAPETTRTEQELSASAAEVAAEPGDQVVAANLPSR